MGVKKENKKFKSNTTYIIHLIMYVIIISLTVWIFCRLINATEQELIDRYSKQELLGGASQKGAIAIQRMLINTFGKFGLVAIPLFGLIGLFNVLLKELFEYVRYLKKSKLFRQGLVSNLDDNDATVSIFKRIRHFLGSRYKKNPSNRKMRNELKKNKFYK